LIAGLHGDARLLVLATTVALMLGSITFLVGTAADVGVRLSELFGKDLALLLLAGAVGVAAALLLHSSARPVLSLWTTGFLQLSTLAAVLLAGLWMHPQRSAVWGVVAEFLSRRRA
jgi:hypothetical protein